MARVEWTTVGEHSFVAVACFIDATDGRDETSSSFDRLKVHGESRSFPLRGPLLSGCLCLLRFAARSIFAQNR